ncbi:MAG: hypothetical protein J1G02_06055 [Clostridiales bacterium]|nr:hypothetical protein [Clostridiales bacterium]
MSGPKYYSFPTTSTYSFSTASAEEAAGVLARFSAFQRGVHATVIGNQIQVTVSNDGWMGGASYGYIAEQIEKAKRKFQEDKEMARLLKVGKEDEVRRVRDIKSKISKQADNKRKSLNNAIDTCRAMAREADYSVSTPFGNYDMKQYVGRCNTLVSSLSEELSGVSAEASRCSSNCDSYSAQVSSCSSLTELSQLQRNAPEMSVKQTYSGAKVDALASEIKSKKKQLTAFTQFLVELDKTVTDNGLTAYRDRLVRLIKSVDAYSPSAVQQVRELLEQIEQEHQYLQQQMKIKRSDEKALSQVQSQLNALSSLKQMLKPLTDGVDVQAESQIDYEKLSKSVLDECYGIVEQLNGLAFCSGLHKNEIDKIKQTLDRCRNFLRSPDVYAQLNAQLTKLRDLHVVCTKDAELYDQFVVEYERYKELYVKFRAMLCSDESDVDDKDGYIEEPGNIVFEYSDAKKQIAILAERNAQLQSIISQTMQQTFTSGLSALLQQSHWGQEFKRERLEDESIHLSYVRKADKGAIFDVSCGKNGEIALVPRGVILSNGRTAITPDGLRRVHSSCEWAEEIGKAFADVGIKNGTYEEMPDEYREELYDLANYYVISSESESIRFLRMSGFTDKEIAELGYNIAKKPTADRKSQASTESNVGAMEIKPKK